MELPEVDKIYLVTDTGLLNWYMIGKVIIPVDHFTNSKNPIGIATFIVISLFNKSSFNLEKEWAFAGEVFGIRSFREAKQYEKSWLECCIRADKLVKRLWCFSDFLKFKVNI